MSDGNKVTIDWYLVDKLLEAGNDGIRVAANLGIHPNTLYTRCESDNGCGFRDYIAQKRARGESLILAKQYEQAMNGNTTMLVWVGKQMCGQKDQQDINSSITVNTIDYSNAQTIDNSNAPSQISTERLSTIGSESP